MDESAFVLLWQFETIDLFIYLFSPLPQKKSTFSIKKIVQKKKKNDGSRVPSFSLLAVKNLRNAGGEAARLTEPRAGRNVRYKYSRVGLVICARLARVY